MRDLDSESLRVGTGYRASSVDFESGTVADASCHEDHDVVDDPVPLRGLHRRDVRVTYVNGAGRSPSERWRKSSTIEPGPAPSARPATSTARWLWAP